MITSGMFTIGQIILLRQKSIRRYLQLPELNPLVQPKQGGMTAVGRMSLNAAMKQLSMKK
jgi:hypothetical protein